MVTRQPQVECRTGKVRLSETDVLPLSHATNQGGFDHLILNILAWSPHYKKDKILIERIQKRFTRMILYIKEFPCEARLKKLGLWSLEDRRIRADLIEVFKIIHS